MMNQVTEGVLSSRRDGARTEAGAQVRDTQTQLNAARFNLINARYQVRIAKAQLEQLIGREIR